jgi:hypothetical protein
MESIICSVKDIETADRQAFEHILGRPLADHQQLIIRVVNADMATTRRATEPTAVTLPDWCNVYEGLSDDEVSALEDVVLTRADLSREPK